MIVSITRSFLNGLTVKEVKIASKRIGVGGYSKLKKFDVIDNVIKLLSIKIIQRWYRKKTSNNSVCPISLDIVNYPCWSKKTATGRIYYNLEPLANYLLIRGDFRDPSTREIYSNEDLLQIDSLVKSNKLKIRKSVRRAKDNKSFYRRQRANEEQIDILTERIRFIFCTIRDKINDVYNGYEDINEMTTQLDVSHFPMTREYLKILNRRDKQALKISFHNINKIMSDVKHDCHIIKHLKTMIMNWIEKETKKYKI